MKDIKANILRKIRAFILGMHEYRKTLTTSFDTWVEYEVYDKGCDLAHRLTKRKFDPNYKKQ